MSDAALIIVDVFIFACGVITGMSFVDPWKHEQRYDEREAAKRAHPSSRIPRQRESESDGYERGACYCPWCSCADVHACRKHCDCRCHGGSE